MQAPEASFMTLDSVYTFPWSHSCFVFGSKSTFESPKHGKDDYFWFHMGLWVKNDCSGKKKT